MGSMLDAFEAYADSLHWCEAARNRFRIGPPSPQEYYARTDNRFRAWEWMHALETLNPSKAQELLRQSVGELLDGELAREPEEVRARLRAVADGTADHAELIAWWEIERLKAYPHRLVVMCGRYFGGIMRENKVHVAQIIIVLRSNLYTEGAPSPREADAIMREVWMGRCTPEEFANGHD